MHIKRQLLALLTTAFFTIPAKADEVTPETACLFFFDLFTPPIEGMGAPTGRPFKVVEMGERVLVTKHEVPRYRTFSWPDAMAKSYQNNSSPIEAEPIAFEFSCLVDVKARQVTMLSVGPGARVAELVEIQSGLSSLSKKISNQARPVSISLHDKPTLGVF